MKNLYTIWRSKKSLIWFLCFFVCLRCCCVMLITAHRFFMFSTSQTLLLALSIVYALIIGVSQFCINFIRSNAATRDSQMIIIQHRNYNLWVIKIFTKLLGVIQYQWQKKSESRFNSGFVCWLVLFTFSMKINNTII